MYLEIPRRKGPGKFEDRGIEVINLGYATDQNTSGYKVYIPSEKTIRITNQLQFDEDIFPMRDMLRKRSKISEEPEDPIDDPFPPLDGDSEYFAEYDFDILDQGFKIVSIDHATKERLCVPLTAPQCRMKVPMEEVGRLLMAMAKRSTEQPSKEIMAAIAEFLPKPSTLKALHADKVQEDLPIPPAPAIPPLPSKVKGLSLTINASKPPRNYKDALSREDHAEWQEAYLKEYLGMKSRDAMVYATPPPGTKLLGTLTRTEYKVGPDGVFDKRKVRLCIRGDQQIEGVNYVQQDLYAPTLKAPEARLIAAIAAQHGSKLYKTDCKQAFLYGEMDDVDIYVRPPDWWPEHIPDGQVLLLKKSVYGTKQAARRWHVKIAAWMEDQGYGAVNNEKTIFMKWVGKDFIIHGLFVDDMQHTATDPSLMDEFLRVYRRDFEITGGDLMTTFLGLEIEQDNDEIRIHMDSYLQEILAEYSKVVNKAIRPKKLPCAPNHILRKEDCPEVPDPLASHYRSIVMKAQFMATWIRFDISYSVSQLARFCANPGKPHMAALHHLMEYLSRYPSLKLTYRRGVRSLSDFVGYVDSDWAMAQNRRSTTGYVSLYSGTPIAWKSKQQSSVALSSAEAEYMAASEYAKQVIHRRGLLKAMGFDQGPPTTVYEDNTACIEWGNNVIGGREQAKHIDIRKHFANEAIQSGHFTLVKISTSSQLADIMTKGLQGPQWEMCIVGLLRERLQTTETKVAMAQEGE